MELKVIASGSKGNSYILENDNEALILEAGVTLKDIKKVLDFNINKIVGVLISHRHFDHSKYISEFMKSGIEVYSSDETQTELEIITGEYIKAVVPNKSYLIGNFLVQPFELVHNVHCLGYYIKHKDFGKLLFITDSEYVPQDFSKLGINHIMIEANFMDELTCKSDFKRVHVIQDHMSIDTTCEFLRQNDNPNLKNVVLLHLSDGSSDENEFLRKAKESVKSANVYVADKGLEIEL